MSQVRGFYLSRCSRPLSLLLPLLLVLLLNACSEQAPPPRPPPEFPVVDVIQRDQAISLEMVGQTLGSSDVPIRARVDGFLETMDFVEGHNVEKGDLLYTIDETPFKTAIVEAQGLEAEAETALVKSKSDLQRLRPLAAMNAISQMDLDAAVAEHDAAIGAVQVARAQVRQAEIVLGYCSIHSPISGRIGISNVQVGEYVGGPSSGLLNLVSQVDPIRVRFSIDEKSYLKIARKIIAAKSDGGDKRRARGSLEFTLMLADGSIHKHVGRVVTTNAIIDSTTGTFTLEADFPNPDRLVLAGQYARIRADVEVRKAALLVPQRSIVELQGGFSLFVVAAEGKVEQRKVQPGPKINKLQIISSGLKPGEKVLLEGVQKVKNGMTIKAIPGVFDEKASSPASNTSEV
ncbi:MAG: efflux RND transporter periplasmic adaptor subunit [Gammaproteobacteria bacterium]|nr:efflux RND transporter periplasmic adaptor subunit [Gammaproteobacteria bacterium]MBQ0840769.1 efflux RND transporter periplasmic adaptor subunit [Gammaproteobacteria bacterium]